MNSIVIKMYPTSWRFNMHKLDKDFWYIILIEVRIKTWRTVITKLALQFCI